MPQITRPQVYRVVRELMPKERFGPEELLLWLVTSSNAMNGPDYPMRNVGPPAMPLPAYLHKSSL